MLTILSMSASSLRSDSRMRSKVTRTSCSKLMGLLSDGIATPTWPATKIQLPASVSIRTASLKLLAIGLAKISQCAHNRPLSCKRLDGGGVARRRTRSPCPAVDIQSFLACQIAGWRGTFLNLPFELVHYPAMWVIGSYGNCRSARDRLKRADTSLPDTVQTTNRVCLPDCAISSQNNRKVCLAGKHLRFRSSPAAC